MLEPSVRGLTYGLRFSLSEQKPAESTEKHLIESMCLFYQNIILTRPSRKRCLKRVVR